MLSVQSQWAIPEPQFVERTTATVPRLFCVVHRVRHDDRKGTDMNTLSNGSLHGEEAASPCVGVTPDAIPEARNSQTGVSVRYVPSVDKSWFVLRASYGREVRAADLLIDSGAYAYVPQRYEMVERDGRRRKVLKSLLPNIIFAYLTQVDAELFVKGPSRKFVEENKKRQDGHGMSEQDLARTFTISSLVTYYYNHFERAEDDDEKNPPLIVSDREMHSFILATHTRSSHLKQVDLEKCRFLDDSMVEVIQGNYKGVKGRIARVAGQQCIVVSLANGKWNISTDYIPTPFIRVLDDKH